jgi:hypothetical protein
VALATALIAAVGINQVVRARSRARCSQSVLERTVSAQVAEQAGRLGQALAELDGALTLARAIEPEHSERLVALGRLRDRVARRTAQAQLDSIDQVEPRQAVGACLMLQARARTDPALVPLETPIGAALDRVRLRAAAADAAAARRSLESGRAVEALELCGALLDAADELAPKDRSRVRAETNDLAGQVIARHGVILDPVRGSYTLGSIQAYTSALNSLLENALRARGYLPRPTSSPWLALWDRSAPYRVAVEAAELQEETYLQSPNRISRIEVQLIVSRHGRTVWLRPVQARTRVPLPRMAAYPASRLAVGDHRDPDFERLLYNDAFTMLVDQFALKLRSLPRGGVDAP